MNKNTTLLVASLLVCLLFLTFLAIASPSVAEAAFVCSADSDCGFSGFVGEQFCQGDKNLFGNYVTYTCNNPGSQYSSCTSSKNPQLIRTCNTDQNCKQGIWFIGCASATDSDGTNTNPSSNINAGSYDYLRCAGNSVYWFDRYGNQKSLYQTCGYTQTCQHNACVNNTVQTNCTSHATRGCFNNSSYWYNSCGTQQELYQSCSANGLTCSEGQCVATQAQLPITPTPTTTVTPAPVATPNIAPTPAPKTSYVTVYKNKENLVVSIFGKKEADNLELKKDITANQNEKINFVLVIKNISEKSLDNVLLKIEMPNAINYSGNLKIDNTASSENILSELKIGTLAKGTSKLISFDGTLQNAENNLKVTATVNSGAIFDSDFLTLNIENAQITSDTSNKQTAGLTNSFIANFLKKWYIWGLILLVLIILFVIIFRKLSSRV